MSTKLVNQIVYSNFQLQRVKKWSDGTYTVVIVKANDAENKIVHTGQHAYVKRVLWNRYRIFIA